MPSAPNDPSNHYPPPSLSSPLLSLLHIHLPTARLRMQPTALLSNFLILILVVALFGPGREVAPPVLVELLAEFGAVTAVEGPTADIVDFLRRVLLQLRALDAGGVLVCGSRRLRSGLIAVWKAEMGGLDWGRGVGDCCDGRLGWYERVLCRGVICFWKLEMVGSVGGENGARSL